MVARYIDVAVGNPSVCVEALVQMCLSDNSEQRIVIVYFLDLTEAQIKSGFDE